MLIPAIFQLVQLLTLTNRHLLDAVDFREKPRDILRRVDCSLSRGESFEYNILLHGWSAHLFLPICTTPSTFTKKVII